MTPLHQVLVAALLGLAGSLSAGPAGAPAPAPSPPIPPGQTDASFADRATLLSLRRSCLDVSRQGAEAALEALHEVLLRLGDDPDEVAPFHDRWKRNLAQGKASTRRLTRIAEDLRELALELASGLEEATESRRGELAQLLLELDSGCEPAAEQLGKVNHEGLWIEKEDLARLERRSSIADLVRRARRIEIDVDHSYDESATTLELYEAPIASVSYRGRINLRGPYEPAKLERILTSALRGAALSSALLGGELEIPRLERHDFFLAGSGKKYLEALEESLSNRGIPRWQYDAHDSLGLESYLDLRGWRTCKLRSEADYQALLLWDVMADWLVSSPQPCLVAGHLNWICLNLFGTKMPQSAIPPDAPGKAGTALASSAEVMDVLERQALWRTAQHGLAGCRMWMIQRLREGDNPPWVRSMTDHIGKVGGEALLKTTLVVEYLQDSGRLREIFEKTRAARNRPIAFEEALGEPLPRFEERWAAWLLAEGRVSEVGVVQLLEAAARAAEAPARKKGPPALLSELNSLRAQAMVGQSPEFRLVQVYEDLSAGARAHALYLARHPGQLLRWPDAHEQYPDREGFSAAGAWAGQHSVIWPGREEDALTGLMGTFFHRLPLLDPGLIGVGIGNESGIVVLDTGSLVLTPWREHWVAWPPDGAQDVPLAFVPELPSPVPGENPANWGYPITLQVYRPVPKEELFLDLSLWKRSAQREAVECFSITPQKPLNLDAVPQDAWCLIPRRPLEARTRYLIEARVAGEPQPRLWSFETGE